MKKELLETEIKAENKVDTGEVRLDEVLSIYRNVYNASNILVESITQLGKLELTDDDILKINKIHNKKSEELFRLADGINYFKEHSEEILNGLV